jgi:hypothetical protein
MTDFVYYLEEDGEFLPEMIFESEQEAIDYAEEKAMKNYKIIEWDCD